MYNTVFLKNSFVLLYLSLFLKPWFTQRKMASFEKLKLLGTTRFPQDTYLMLCQNYDIKVLHSIIFHQHSLILNEFVLGHDPHGQIKQ